MKRKSLLMILLMALFAPWAANAQTLFSEGFEGGSMPSGWTTDGPGTWSVGSGDYSTSTGAGMGTYNALITHNTTGNVTKLITPEIDLSSYSSATLSFMHIQRSWAGDIDQLRVYYRTSSSGTWTQLLEYTSAIASWTTEEDIILPNTTATYQLAFEHTDKYGYGVGLDQVVITAPSACPKPTLGAAQYITDEGASFQWTENGTSTTWELQYSTSNDFSSPTTITRNGIPSYAITGLLSGTTYYVHVRSYCGDGQFTDWSNTVSFRTLCGAYSLPYFYGFEDAGDMDCWDVYGSTSSSTGITSADDAPEGSKVFRFHYSERDAYLISPVFTGTTNGLSVTFQYMNSSTTTSYTEEFQVGYTTNASETDPSNYTYSGTIYGENEWVLYENVFPANTKRIAIKYIYTDGLYLRLDDFAFEVPSGCIKPTDLAIVDVTASSAVLRWVENGTATAWDVEVTDLDGGQVTTWRATATTYQIVGLAQETNYSVRVNPVCDVDKWSDPITFATPANCPRPTNLTVSDVTPMGATVTWAGEANSYNLAVQEPVFFYGFEDATPWVEDHFDPCTTYDGDGLTTYQITDWTPLGEYQFVGSMMTLQSGVTDFASAHGGELFGGFVAGIPADGVTHNDDYLILPSITIENGYVFEFWASSLLDNWGLEHMRVGVYGGNGTFTEYLAGSATDYVEVPNGWTKYSYNLSAFAGQTIQLAINSLCPDAYILGIDDIFVGYNYPTPQAVVINDATSPYDLELDPETTYQVLVQSVCGGDNGNSAWVYEIFTTPSNCAAPSNLEASDVMPASATLSWEGYQESYNIQYRTAEHRDTYYFYDFNNGNNSATAAQEEGWEWEGSIIYGFEDPIYNVASSSNYFLQMGWATTDEAYIYSPELPAYASGAMLEFYYFGYNIENTFQVGYSTTTNDASAFTWGDPITAPLQTYTLFSEVLPDGVKYVGFKATASESGASIFIDDFGVFGPELVPAGEWITVTNVTSPYDLEGLSDDTPYEWQVQGINPNCDGGKTEWSAMSTFETPGACDGIESIWIDDLTATTMTLSWDGVQYSYLVQYRTSEGPNPKSFYDAANEQGDWTTDNLEEESGWDTNPGYFTFYYNSTVTPPQTLISPELTGTAPNALLEFIYRAYSSSYEETFKVGFSTTGTDLDNDFTWGDEITSTNTYFLTYSVSVPDGAKYFAIQYTADDQFGLLLDNFAIGPFAEAGEWNYVTVDEPTVTLTGLDPQTEYEVYVQGICGDDQYTAQVGGLITTLEETNVTQVIPLSAGTNWVSFYVETDLDALKAALVEALPGATSISIQSQNKSTTYNGSRWRGQLSALDMAMMYAIKCTADCEITLEGMPVDPAEHPVTLVGNGSTWMGFPLQQSMAVADAFAGFAVSGDKVSAQTTSATYNGSRWRGGLTNLEPGQGYVYKSSATEDRVFTFPTSTSKAVHTAFNVSQEMPALKMDKSLGKADPTVNSNKDLSNAIKTGKSLGKVNPNVKSKSAVKE